VVNASVPYWFAYDVPVTDQPTAPSEYGPLVAERDALIAERDALVAELAEARQAAEDWRRAALSRWDEVAATAPAGPAVSELEAVRNTVSWRVTRPLRAVSRVRQLARGTDA
jgi:hypothetical protein